MKIFGTCSIPLMLFLSTFKRSVIDKTITNIVHSQEVHVRVCVTLITVSSIGTQLIIEQSNGF